MEEDMKRWEIPAFGHWDHCDELPITQYFESAWQAGHSFREDADLFKVPAPAPAKPAHHHQRKGKKRGGGKDQQREQGRAWDEASTGQTKPRRTTTTRAPKAVDEDLYKIPPELLYKKPKRKGLVRDLVSRCLGVLCIL